MHAAAAPSTSDAGFSIIQKKLFPNHRFDLFL